MIDERATGDTFGSRLGGGADDPNLLSIVNDAGGTIASYSEGLTTIVGNYRTAGTTTIEVGALKITGTVEQVAATGQFQLRNFSTFESPNVLRIREGRIDGDGTVKGGLSVGYEDSNIQPPSIPVIAPGLPAAGGTIRVEGNFHLYNGELHIHIYNPNLPGGYDRVEVTGNASLTSDDNGRTRKLFAQVMPGANIPANTEFPFMTYESNDDAGNFTVFDGVALTWQKGQEAKKYWLKPPADVQVPKAKVGGIVWQDNGALAGVFEPGEEDKLQGVAVRLFNEDGTTQIASTTTNEDGEYEFDDLAAGIYLVQFDRPSDKRFAVANATTDNLDSDPDPLTSRVLVDLSQDQEDVFAGLYDDTAPIAVNDTVKGHKNTAVAGNVLLNDSDADGDTLTASLDTDVSHGSLTLNPDGSFTYTPDTDWYGTDTLTYSVDDGYEGTDTATVTITVANTLAPVGVDDEYEVTDGDLFVEDEDGVLANDTDQNNGTLTAVLATEPSHGTLWLGEDGSFYYVPDDDFVGTDTFTYYPTDADGPGNLTTVSIAVTNHPPVAVDDEDEVDEDDSVTIALLANDTDADEDELTILGVSDALFGEVVDNEDGTVTYTPFADFNGTDTFYYTISDGHGRISFAAVTITVNPVNDAPVAVADAAPVATSTLTNINVLANDTDVDGDTLTITSVTQGANGGTVAITGGGSGLSYDPGMLFTGTDTFTYTISDGHGGTATASVTIRVDNHAPYPGSAYATVHAGGTVTFSPSPSDPDGDSPLTVTILTQPGDGTLTWNAATGNFTYVAPVVISGSSVSRGFTYRVTDPFGAYSDGTGTITVTNSNPTASGSTPTVHGWSNNAASRPGSASLSGNVLSMASDTDGDSLTASLGTGPSNGTVTVAANGAYTYLPNKGFVGSDSFTFVVGDGHGGTGGGTISITVANMAPTPGSSSGYVVHSGYSTSIPVTLTDSDGDPLVVTITQPHAGLTSVTYNPTTQRFTYTAPPTFAGTVTIYYSVDDGFGSPQAGSLTVEVTNSAPMAPTWNLYSYGGSPVPIDLATLASDMDGDALTVGLVASDVTNFQNSGYGAFSPPSGTVVTFTPASPPSSFELHYWASDGIAPTVHGSIWIYCM